MFVYVVVCLLAFVILSVLIPTCYHRSTFVVFVVSCSECSFFLFKLWLVHMHTTNGYKEFWFCMQAQLDTTTSFNWLDFQVKSFELCHALIGKLFVDRSKSWQWKFGFYFSYYNYRCLFTMLFIFIIIFFFHYVAYLLYSLSSSPLWFFKPNDSHITRYYW